MIVLQTLNIAELNDKAIARISISIEQDVTHLLHHHLNLLSFSCGYLRPQKAPPDTCQGCCDASTSSGLKSRAVVGV
ncbi:hypothetical protein EYF80_013817 [Liparis tanakae]|uniref:Uncharacterized protein n=1 Tax=Liparis tanakae TaxID=230148 RepID=A0A4Z2IF20_9TELE|nr:hypothetical protein EYF80_013817 [Liparis tanakae]